MSIHICNIPADLHQYILDHGVREHPVMTELREVTSTLPQGQMQISADQAQFMAMLVQILDAKNIIELGTFTGYSALAMALAMPEDGRIICCDISDEWTSIAKKHWGKAGVENKIDLRIAPALKTLDSLINENKTSTFDLIFIDADKSAYPDYYERALTLLRPGGLVLLDNVFKNNKVLEAGGSNGTIAIRELNKKIHADERVDICMIPVADGMTIARKR